MEKGIIKLLHGHAVVKKKDYEELSEFDVLSNIDLIEGENNHPEEIARWDLKDKHVAIEKLMAYVCTCVDNGDDTCTVDEYALEVHDADKTHYIYAGEYAPEPECTFASLYFLEEEELEEAVKKAQRYDADDFRTYYWESEMEDWMYKFLSTTDLMEISERESENIYQMQKLIFAKAHDMDVRDIEDVN